MSRRLPLLLLPALALAFVANLFVGTVPIDASTVFGILCGRGASGPESYIVLNSRLPAALTALLGGGALAVAGLMMQTTFRNPLAGPSIMGITSGASVGVALVTLLLGGTLTASGLRIGGEMAVMAGALAGSLLVMAVIIFLSTILKNDLMLLIAGIMIGYLASSFITLLNFSASSEGVHSYVMWGMGSFRNVSMERIVPFAAMVGVGMVMAVCLIKPLDLLLLGDDYARSLGVNVPLARRVLLLSTGVLAAAATAFCGPVSFVGLAVPHIARLLTRTDTHRRLLPATFVCGCVVALLCNVVCALPSVLWPSAVSAGLLPLNAVTPLFGVPVILFILLRRK